MKNAYDRYAESMIEDYTKYDSKGTAQTTYNDCFSRDEEVTVTDSGRFNQEFEEISLFACTKQNLAYFKCNYDDVKLLLK